MMKSSSYRRLLGTCAAVALLPLVLAGSAPPGQRDSTPSSGGPIGQDAAQLPRRYGDWLDQVQYLISEAEREYFFSLKENFRREAFMERFWEVRDPEPRTGYNELKRRWEHWVVEAADYLAYAQLDSLVDSLYPVLEKYGEWIEGVEQALLAASDPAMLETIQSIRRDLLWIRRIAWPHREVMHGLERLETDLIKEDTREFLRDSYDHAVQLMDVVETFRELAGGLTDLYLSTASNRMNEVMKVLTIMASIFIPLTFIAGIYGMNFNPESISFSMPELNWDWGYPTVLLMMLVIAVGMVLYFRRKKWL